MTIATDEQNSFQVDFNPSSMPKRVNTLQFNDLTSGFLRVNLWVAWNNYGIGYLMSNNSIGVIFFDKTTLFYAPCYTKILYNKPADPDAMTSQAAETSNYSPILPQKRAQQVVEEYSLDQLPKLPQHLHKKYKLLVRFRSEFKHMVQKDR